MPRSFLAWKFLLSSVAAGTFGSEFWSDHSVIWRIFDDSKSDKCKHSIQSCSWLCREDFPVQLQDVTGRFFHDNSTSDNLFNPRSSKCCVLWQSTLTSVKRRSLVSFTAAFLIKNSELWDWSGQRPEFLPIFCEGCLLPFCLSTPRTSPGLNGSALCSQWVPRAWAVLGRRSRLFKWDGVLMLLLEKAFCYFPEKLVH